MLVENYSNSRQVLPWCGVLQFLIGPRPTKQPRGVEISTLAYFSTATYTQQMLNLPGWRWARIKQLALVGSSSSLHSEVCKALRGSSGVVYSKISGCGNTRTRGCQHLGTSCIRILETIYYSSILTPFCKASQRSLHNEPIFRLLLKVAVIGAR